MAVGGLPGEMQRKLVELASDYDRLATSAEWREEVMAGNNPRGAADD